MLVLRELRLESCMSCAIVFDILNTISIQDKYNQYIIMPWILSFTET